MTLLHRKNSKTETANVFGKPKISTLTSVESSLFKKAGITVPSNDVLVWPSLSLPLNLSLTSDPQSVTIQV